MLQRRLQHLVGRRRRQHRAAVRVGRRRAVEEVVVVHGLAEREVARGRAAGVADDVRHLLHHVGGRDPGLDRVLARRLDQVVELAARGRGALRLAAAQVDAPAADPGHGARQRQVERGLDARGVVGDRAGAGLELVERDGRVVEAAAAARDGAVIERQCLRDHEVGIDFGERHAVGEVLDRGLHGVRGRCAVGPAVVELVAQAHHEARLVRRIEVDLRTHRRVGDVDVGLGEERRLRRGRARRMAARAVLLEQRIDGRAEQRRIGRERLAVADFLDRGRLQRRTARAAERLSGPVADPHRELVAAGRVGREPAIVAAADLRDHHRVARVRQVDDAVRGLVGEVDVVAAHEARDLAAGAMALAAAVRSLQVVPDVELERLHVLARRRRAGIAGRRRRRRGRVLLGRGAAPAAREREHCEHRRQGGEDAHTEADAAFHRLFLNCPCSTWRHRRTPASADIRSSGTSPPST